MHRLHLRWFSEPFFLNLIFQIAGTAKLCSEYYDKRCAQIEHIIFGIIAKEIEKKLFTAMEKIILQQHLWFSLFIELQQHSLNFSLIYKKLE